jgi:hypothetical protein
VTCPCQARPFAKKVLDDSRPTERPTRGGQSRILSAPRFGDEERETEPLNLIIHLSKSKPIHLFTTPVVTDASFGFSAPSNTGKSAEYYAAYSSKFDRTRRTQATDFLEQLTSLPHMLRHRLVASGLIVSGTLTTNAMCLSLRSESTCFPSATSVAASVAFPTGEADNTSQNRPVKG